MKQLVKLNKRPTWDDRGFTYFLRYEGEDGKPLVMQTGERLRSSEPKRKKSLEWVILNPALSGSWIL